jgi:probable non-F420 flavinoid oxidoreductase
MSLICYHASHEQFSPSHLIRLVIEAEKAGFGGIHSSDHFHPWSIRQGHSGFTFSWIAAALQVTHIPFSMVCAPGQRYHPAVVAQAIATLGEMFPGRINVELGSGEALNEMITDQGWPDKEIRNERLLECFVVLKKLLRGEEVTHRGHVRVNEAKIYTLPERQPLLLCAAISKKTSGWCGSWADGLLTTATSYEESMEKIDAFRNNGGEGKPVYLQYSFSYARSEEEAKKGAHEQWRSNVLDPADLATMYKPEHFDEASKDTTIEEVIESIPIFTDMSQLLQQIGPLEKTGAERIVLHNVNRLQENFIEDYGKAKRLPHTWPSGTAVIDIK